MESPLKPVKKKNKAARIESDSDDDEMNNDDDEMNNDDIAAALLDSDSDVEIIAEDWRPPRSTSQNTDSHQQTCYNQEEEFLTRPPTQTVLFKIPKVSSQSEFKAPTLPLNPKYYATRKRGLRSRTNYKSSSKSSNKVAVRRGRVLESSDEESKSDDSSDISPAGKRNRLRRVPISIDEELIGEADIPSSDEEVGVVCYELCLLLFISRLFEYIFLILNCDYEVVILFLCSLDDEEIEAFYCAADVTCSLVWKSFPPDYPLFYKVLELFCLLYIESHGQRSNIFQK